MDKHTQSELDLDIPQIGVGMGVKTNDDTVLPGSGAAIEDGKFLTGTVIEIRENNLPYVVEWQNGQTEIHNRRELTRMTLDEILDPRD